MVQVSIPAICSSHSQKIVFLSETWNQGSYRGHRKPVKSLLVPLAQYPDSASVVSVYKWRDGWIDERINVWIDR